MTLSRATISEAVSGIGWRSILGALRTRVAVSTMAQAVDVAARVSAAVDDGVDVRDGVAVDDGGGADRAVHPAGPSVGHLSLDLRANRVILLL